MHIIQSVRFKAVHSKIHAMTLTILKNVGHNLSSNQDFTAAAHFVPLNNK